MRWLLLLLTLLLSCDAFAVQRYSKLYGVPVTLYFYQYDVSDGSYETDETDDGNDATVYCNDGSGSASTNDYAADTNGSGYKLTLTAAEMSCAGVVRVEISETDSGLTVLMIDTVGDASAAIPWVGMASGVAQSGTSTTIVLASGTNIADGLLANQMICTLAGTGARQCRLISDWEQSSDTATISAAWTVNPSNDTVYIVLPAHQASMAEFAAYLDEDQGFLDATEMTALLGDLATSSQIGSIEDAIEDGFQALVDNGVDVTKINGCTLVVTGSGSNPLLALDCP